MNSNNCRDKDKRSFKENEFVCLVESMSGNPVMHCDEAHPHKS